MGCSIAAVGLCLSLVQAERAEESDFVPLFDGRTLSGWTYQPDARGRESAPFQVEEGVLICPKEALASRLWTVKEYANFILRFDFRLGPDGNSGIAIRTDQGGRYLEIQIMNHEGPNYSKRQFTPEQFHGSVYGILPARSGFLRVGEWNEQEIRVEGSRITVVLNRVVILDNDLSIVREPEVLKKHPALLNKSGRIGILAHTSRVDFRNVRLKELP